MRPGGVLLKLAVVDGEVGSKVAAVAQRRYAAAEKQGLERKSHVGSGFQKKKKKTLFEVQEFIAEFMSVLRDER